MYCNAMACCNGEASDDDAREESYMSHTMQSQMEEGRVAHGCLGRLRRQVGTC